MDYHASINPLEPPLAGAVSVRISASDLALGLTAQDGHTVLVRGYLGEPFLRLGPGGAAVNTSSPTAAGSGLLKRVRSHGERGWRQLSGEPNMVWHDARLRALPPGVERRPWGVQLAIDGKPAQLVGEVRRDPPPAPWPWILMGLPFIGVATALLLLRPPALPIVTCALGVIGAIAVIISMAGFAFDTNASPGTYVEAGNEVVFALVGLVVAFRGSGDVRAIAGGALGLLALGVGLTKVPALSHGVVLSALPEWAARAGVVLMLASGAAATALGLVILYVTMERADREGFSAGRPESPGGSD